MASFTTIMLYVSAWLYTTQAVYKREQLKNVRLFIALLSLGLVAHSVELYLTMVTANGLYLGFFKIASLFFFVINLLLLFSSLKTPLHSLFVVILPLSIASIVISLFFSSPITDGETLNGKMLLHILLSILAYSLLTIASIQALLLAYQSRQLRSGRFHEVIGIMPPLQTMEKLMFDVVWGGFFFLTLSIVTGLIFIDNIFAQKLSHKTVFSIMSWLIYSVLLAGHLAYGWRGTSAIRGVLGGFIALMLAYFGSKLVLEVILEVY